MQAGHCFPHASSEPVATTAAPTETRANPTRTVAAARRTKPGVADDRGQEEQSEDEVEGDHPARQLQPDCDGAEHRLERDEADGEQRRPQDVGPGAVGTPCPSRRTDGEDTDERNDGAVAVLDDGRALGERDGLRGAERPVRAAEARLGDADAAADGDERPDRERRRGREEAKAEAGHATDSNLLSARVPPQRPPAIPRKNTDPPPGTGA